MADLRKSLFKQDLDKYQVFVQDTQPNSRYFNITELPDTFTGGKNAFLIQGSEYLVPDTLVRIELKDSAGNVIYNEPGEGIVSASVGGEPIVTEYFEGTSKVVAVYIYPDTTYGPCTLTILGELSSYDNNGLITPIPVNWQGAYNVKWQKQINVNPSLPNTTKIRFYKRPTASITEVLSPIYRIESGSKVNSGVSQSFADVKLKNLETFAGDVKRVKVFRTSQGDISDYDLIQDILVESKELLTSYSLTGSVIGQTGILTSETLKNYWNTGSLKAELTSSRVESGVRLSGSGYFTYTSSLDIKSGNTYELNLDAFYSSSTASNLGIYLSYVSQSTTFTSSISTLSGIAPTKNLLDTTIPFKIDKDYPTASLYFSQSQGEWHLGNISLKLSQETAFSPDEISFVTTMPSIIGNETYNFKFEFYDVNNNYVPVFVTQSATFTGGANINTTLLYISSSASSSLSQLYAVSSSISGTMTIYSSSASSSVGTLSGSVSSSLSSLSSSVSSSNLFILSSSLSKVQQLANGQYSGSFIGDTVIYSPTIGGQQGYISSLFKVGTAPSIYLDARTSTRKIYIGGANDTGSYSSGSTFVYMDSTGKFSLKDKLTWDGDNLSVNGTINVTGGNAATDANAQLYASRAVTSGSLSATAAQTAAELFAASAAGRAVTSGSNAASAAQSAAIAQAKSDASASINLLANGDWTAGNTFISSRSISSPVIAGNAGYISSIFKVGNGGITLDGDTKKIFVGNGNYNNSDTPFYFASGSTNIFSLGNKLTFNGNALSVNGSVTATSLTATTTGNIAGWSFDSTKLTSGRIILDSATPQIFMSGSVSKVKIGTRNLVELTGADDQRTVYLGEGGIKITGDWDGTNSEYPSYITLAADSAYAKAIFFNKNVGYSSELVYMYALPYGAGSCLRIENGGARIRNYNDGSGYTGTGNGGYGLQVDSISGTTATFTGDVTANTSDGRLKTNIKNIDSPLEKISKINGVYFNWNEKAKELSEKDTTIREVGFIAQEVKEILPEIVKRAAFDTIMDESITDRVVFKSKSGDEYLTIQYEKIVPLLVEAIKELKNEIEELKKNK